MWVYIVLFSSIKYDDGSSRTVIRTLKEFQDLIYTTRDIHAEVIVLNGVVLFFCEIGWIYKRRGHHNMGFKLKCYQCNLKFNRKDRHSDAFNSNDALFSLLRQGYGNMIS